MQCLCFGAIPSCTARARKNLNPSLSKRGRAASPSGPTRRAPIEQCNQAVSLAADRTRHIESLTEFNVF
jgi:hypothetical protein